MRIVCLVLIGFGLLGCGGEPAYKGEKRYGVSGTVTFGGEPVDGGTISFIGESGDPKKQFPTGGVITGGKYEIASSRGPNAGKYQVEVRWSKPTGKKFKDPDTGEMKDEVKEAIPTRYNQVTTLRADVSGSNTKFDFELVK